ncbi:hypothetical protein F2P56_031105 [Juglans regia]|uniref:Uncharacterized protein n=1 Tax=Juglans regia TaxID=51240 RepID=A0A833T157_JUGRE|nr:hypothetical protein F2P56_031105 [Juglans regia]
MYVSSSSFFVQNSATLPIFGIPILHRDREEMELSKGTEKMVKAQVGQPRFIPKKGSIFPRKRRSVKKIVLDSILKSIAKHLCCLNHHPTSSSLEISTSLPKTPAENYAKNRDVDPVKGPWSPEEDEMLRKLVQSQGARSWSVINKAIAGWSGKSCRLRWGNQLSP